MGETTRGRIRKLLESNEKRSRYLRLLVVAALAVALAVAASFIDNAVAMNHPQLVLDCHATNDVAHTHNADCYDKDGNLVCPLQERAFHAHTDSCYVVKRKLVCGLKESEGHHHDDSCYKVTRKLTCNLPELTKNHVHGPGCFVTVTVSDDSEGAPGIGGGDATDIDNELIDPQTAAQMPKQSFTHNFMQTAADGSEQLMLRVDVLAPVGALPKGSTMSADWVDIAGLSIGEQNALDAALTQANEGMVLQEQAVDLAFYDADGNEVEPARKLTVTFTSASANTEDKPVVVHIRKLSEDQAARQAKAQKQLAKQGGAQPEEGSELANDLYPERKAEVVDELGDQELAKRDITLTPGQVAFESDQFSTYVLAYTTMRHTMLTKGHMVTITVEAPASAGIPADAVLQVSEIDEVSRAYGSYLGRVSQVVGEQNIQLARFFDIKILSQGQEVQPVEPIQVKIELAGAPTDQDASATVVHFADEGGMDLVAATEDAGTTTFDAEGFSVYGVVYTVDFHYAVNGQAYDWSIPGSSYTSLRELVDTLGVADSANMSVDDFVAGVESVEFSDPDLVWVGKAETDTTLGGLKLQHNLQCEPSANLTEDDIAAIDAQSVAAGDWALVSLRPFTSNESLRVTMSNGEVFSIAVTDEQISTHVITADGADYEITVTYGPEAEIPDNARLRTSEITADNTTFASYLEQAVKEAGEQDAAKEPADVDAAKDSSETLPKVAQKTYEIQAATTEAAPNSTYARFFDIQIWADDHKVEPKAEVSVHITLVNVPNEAQDDLQVVHFGTAGAELLAAEESQADKDGESVTELSFVTDGFSVYSIVSVGSGTDENIFLKEYVLVANGAALSPEQHPTNANNLRAISVTVNNSAATITTTDDTLPTWKIERYWKNEANAWRYYLTTTVGGAKKYLNMQNQNNGKVSLSDTPQDLIMSANGSVNAYEFRVAEPYNNINNNVSLDLSGGKASNGFSTYKNGNTANRYFTLYELGAEIFDKVTVHFVDREGNPMTDVAYTGNNTNYVVKNTNGTFSIRYDWKGTSGTVDLKRDFSLSGYTYANAHLAKNSTTTGWNSGDGVNYNHNGIAIDSTFTSNGSKLSYVTYIGHNNYTQNNTNSDSVMNLETFSFSDTLDTWTFPIANNSKTRYVEKGSKDVYVILDPKAPTSGTSTGTGTGSGSSGSGQEGSSSDTDPNFKKTLVANGDGTYTLSLSVTGHALNNTEYPKANVLLVVDTSSSMVNNNDSVTGKTRLEETKKCLKSFAESLFALNGDGQAGHAPADTVEVAMFSFDGSTHDLTDTWMKTNREFATSLNTLRYHKGTNWEDALQKAYEVAHEKRSQDHDPTFVVFFTDGEPSQYTNFHETHPNDPNDKTNGWKYFHPYLSRETSKDEARQLVADGLRFYSVFAYGKNTPLYNGESCTELLHNLVKYGYNTTADLKNKYFFDAQNTNDMTRVFTSILHAITSKLGISDVVLTDSITSLTSVGVTPSGDSVHGFHYTRSGGKYGAGQEWANAPEVTFVPENEAAGQLASVTWNPSSSPDLPNGLEDGVTYTVSFTVWPSQDAYDYVTKLNNGVITSIDEIPEQHRSCFTYNQTTGRYEVVTNPESGPGGQGNIVNKTSYKKEESETVTALPQGASTSEDNPVIVGPGSDWPQVTIKTWYTDNKDGTWTKHVITEGISALNPPDKNMALDGTAFKIQKVWQVDREEKMIQFLYDVTTGQPIEAHKYVPFTVNQVDNPSAPEEFAEILLGYDETLHDYRWADETHTVLVHGIAHNVGRVWEKDLNISYGQLLSPQNAVDRYLDTTDARYIPIYESEEAHANGDISYYVLEKGHDYLVTEPTLDYRFEFQTEVYHPMLVNGEPSNVKIEYKGTAGNEYGLLEETEGSSVLSGANVMRGDLKMRKLVVGPDGAVDPDSNEVFDFIVTLSNDSEPGPFYIDTNNPDEQHIPWYGVQHNGTGEVFYYHKKEPLADGSIEYANELTACVGGNYLNGLLDGYEGNIMVQDAATPQNKVTAEIKIRATDVWTITNIPSNTTYTIEEVPTKGYEFVDAEQVGSNPQNKVASPENPSISGSVALNGTTEVVFRNEHQLEFEIIKVDVDDLDAQDPQMLQGAELKLQKYQDVGYHDLDTTWGTGGEKTATETAADPGRFHFAGLKQGYYKLVETARPDGYVKTETDPLFKVVFEEGRFELLLLLDDGNGNLVTAVDNRGDQVKVETITRKLLADAGEGGPETDDGLGANSESEATPLMKDVIVFTYGNASGVELPAAGGRGTVPFMVLGAMLVAGGAALLFRRGEAA